MAGALEGLPGILEAQVNLHTKDVRVRYRPGTVTRKALQDAIARVDVRLRARHRLHVWIARLSGGWRETAGRPREGGRG